MSTLSEHIERGLMLIRLSNGLSRSVARDIEQLGRDIRTSMASDPGSANTKAQKIQAMVIQRFADISGRVNGDLTKLVGLEAEFTRRVMELAQAPSPEAIARAASAMLMQGVPVAEHFRTTGQAVAQQAGGVVRRAVTATGGESVAMRAELRNVVVRAQQRTRALVDGGVHAAATAGRLAALENSGVKTVRWHAVLDPRVCGNCGLRHSRVYQIPSRKPVGHSVPMVHTPPFHPFCRCILLPMRTLPGAVDKADPDRFEHWLETQSPEKQNAILGKGRADLYRAGKITLQELIGQRGLIMTMKELQLRTG